MKAPLHAGMHLGEGTGAVTALALYEYALEVYNRMPSFGDVNIEEYKPFS